MGTVKEEPLLGPVHGPPFKNKSTTVDPLARTDIRVRGFFEPQRDSDFDVVIVDTNKESALKKGLRPETVLENAQTAKRDEYGEHVTRRGGTFTPLACSVYGTLAQESERVLLQIIAKLSDKKGERRATAHCARLRIQLAIIRATSLCIRGRLETEYDYALLGSEDEVEEVSEKLAEEREEDASADLAEEWGDLRVRFGE